jgi:hypothetical protein
MGGDPAKAPPQMKQQMELLNQLAGIELTLNMSNPGPSSFIAHCNDDAAAQKVETMFQQMKQMSAGPPMQQVPGANAAMDQAKTRYRDRLLQMFPLQRDGTKFTLFKVEGQNPSQQQFASAVVVLAGTFAPMVPDIMAMQKAAMRQAKAGMGGPAGGPDQLGPGGQPGSPVPPGGPAAPPGAVNPEAPAPPQQ